MEASVIEPYTNKQHHAKTAISTGIFTGKTIGACSMMYGFVTTNVPSYVNYARLFGQLAAEPMSL